MLGFEQGQLRQAIAWAREQRGRGVSVSLQYDAAPGELKRRQEKGQCRRAVYIGTEGIESFGEADA